MEDMANERERVILLSERNRRLCQEFQPADLKNYKNLVFLDGREIPPEYVAYHVAARNQKVLVPGQLIPGVGDLSLGGVFFSTSLDDLDFYSDAENEECVYFLDLRRVVSARVQKCYAPSVLFEDGIREQMDAYNLGEGSIKGIKDKMGEWLMKYTLPFNPLKVERYKRRGYYIIADAPIKVLESQAQV